MSVKISEFVEKALIEITNGVVAAREKAKVTIAPGAIEGKPIFDANEVHFELLVEVTEASLISGEAEVGGSILAVIKASASATGEQENRSQSTQRISFSVPVHFNSDNIRRPK